MQPTRETLRELAANASVDFTRARSLPPPIYHDPKILALEAARIFRRDWVCVGREAEIPGSGDYLCCDILDAPVFVVRQRDGEVKAFANVCRHRASRLLDGRGHISRISCPYHSWTYDLDGRLIGAPFMQETEGFDFAVHHLRSVSICTWQGFVYVSLSPDAVPLEDRLDELTAAIGDFNMADYVPVHSAEETWATNWKCLVENFMDAYHIHRVHKSTFGQYGSSEDQTQLFAGNDACSYHYVHEADGPKSVETHPDNTWLGDENRHRTWLINIFPSHTIQLQPDMLWYLSILPDGLGKTRVRWSVALPPEMMREKPAGKQRSNAIVEFLNRVNAEDRPVVENVFRTTASPDASRGPLSWLERNVWEFGRYLSRRLND